MEFNLYEQDWSKYLQLEQSQTEIRRTLPRGSHHLAPEQVLLAQKARLIEAAAQCIHQKGYAATSVQDIIHLAGVSRTTFYKLFQDKEACYFHCFKKLSTSHLSVLLQAYQAHQANAKRAFEVATLAFIQQLTVNPVYATAFFALAPYSTAAVVDELNVVKAHYVSLLAYWFAQLAQNIAALHLTQDVFKIVIEGVFSYLRHWIIQGQVQTTENVHHHICYVIFSTLGLHDWASQHVLRLQ
ncbi:TetR/AcrR family transcriptional regulator [Acinetobacter towneri]|uniref:TetR/AcrR family transcriptional regulator n=1 Tax=Acinetobacter towneri TaxID=202956 RepID=UPI001CE084CE|nr:TetR/AcrR family transcriptional regulator [Acinetobacter towneri]MCA4779309.1 TetR/AcrR family transcriptional regulator [Acinetobacter towneri]MCA4784598.1 TetR/AcrR family transcriptional regulator [Acinetobacter towneri]MCA4787402.1 TetR/AcrR family transcriptional regulator [Acinetobacter towneri]MCA4795818.1 TetR/AcrR family transcriptional regulator [Acinetobacter towneri]MCA4800830.1 TetR/AcrR family transcriptional regulator [Acinetobacter towneri]